jgi:carboxypeptidase Taq
MSSTRRSSTKVRKAVRPPFSSAKSGFRSDNRDTYSRLESLAKEIALIGSTASILGWDQETYMPSGAVDHRAAQLSYLSAKAHALFTGKAFRTLLDRATAEDLSQREQSNIAEWRRDLDRAVRIPTTLVAEESEVTSRAKHVWSEAKNRSDFGMFSSHLEAIIRIARKKAALWGFEDEPYDALLTGYERGASTKNIATLFDGLKPKVSRIARHAVERGSTIPRDMLRGRYPVEKQQRLNQEVAESIGFDFQSGRIDTTAHPFCTTLGPADIRLTTRYDLSDFTSSLFGVLHEAGHGLYEQGLPASEFGLPSGSAVSLGIHESQSRLWENHVGRAIPFWERWFPRARELFPNLRKFPLSDFIQFLHRADFSFIRVESDEATYDLHIFLRFDLERRLLAGTLDTHQLPDAWNTAFEELFGKVPPNDAQGCLQDIHWSMGGFGYFPTYTLGNLNAAQLFQAADSRKALRAATRRAEYLPLLEWLRNNVHSIGASLSPTEIITQATGRPTNPAPYLSHLRKRFAH